MNTAYQRVQREYNENSIDSKGSKRDKTHPYIDEPTLAPSRTREIRHS